MSTASPEGHPAMLQLKQQTTQTMPTISRSYRTKTTSPYAMHRRWIQQDMDLQDADMMRAYDQAAYYAEQDGGHTGTGSDA